MSESANAAQIEYWNSRAGLRWAQWQEAIDRSMAELTAGLQEFAAVRAGERVLDVGCGCGSTSLWLAQQVGAGGRVDGIDISAPMLEVASRRAAAARLPIGFVEADAAAYPFGPDYDLVFSRFGLMFFADPVAAFANLRRALRPGGRLVFLCWRPLRENTWATLPLAAARPWLPQTPPADPLAPGPFALAERTRIDQVLAAAGFTGVQVQALDAGFWMGETAEAAALQAMTIGPLAGASAELDSGTRERIRAAVCAALATECGAGEVRLAAAGWLVRAAGA